MRNLGYGRKVEFIEIVLGSDACAGIQATKNGVLKKEIMVKWLRCVVGRGHVSLMASLYTWYFEPFRDIGYIYQHRFRELYKKYSQYYGADQLRSDCVEAVDTFSVFFKKNY